MNIDLMQETSTSDGNSTVRILPESSGNTICVAFSGLVKEADHEVLSKRLSGIMQEYDSFRLLLYYTADFKGWEHDAASVNLETIREYGKRAEKLAYVNPPEKKIFQLKVTPELFGGEVRFFNGEDFHEALAWLQA